MDQSYAVAFTAFADVWPRATETEIGVALCAIGAGKTSSLISIFFIQDKKPTITGYI